MQTNSKSSHIIGLAQNPAGILLAVFSLFFFAQTIQAENAITSPKCNQFTFDASSSYDPDNQNLTFSWDLGDGTKSAEPVVTHSYQTAGNYDVTLTVTDNSKSSSVISRSVRANIRPQAAFNVTDNVCTNQPVAYDASPSSSDNKLKLQFSWDFGDGTNPGTGRELTKIYKKGGTYKTVLTVTDPGQSSCESNTAEKTIIVNEAPKADAGEETLLRCVLEQTDMTVNFDASNSKETNSGALSYYWDFGDGEHAEGETVAHTYKNLGNYDAKLIVKDPARDNCGTGVDFIAVKLHDAPKANAGEDIIACLNDEIFFDGSNSYVQKKGTVSAKWSFGDGETADGMKVSHQYSQAGKYQANLSIESQLNELCPTSKDTKNVTINTAPTVKISAVNSGCVGNKIDFDASSATDPDGDNLEYYWSFGDGVVIKAGPKISHEYKTGGTFKVSVVVDDGLGSNCSSATDEMPITINSAPQANAGANTACCVDKPTSFDASASVDSDGDNLTYHWDFGDGSAQEGIKLQHIYKKGGSYNVVLTVSDGTDSSCSSAQDSYTAQVNASPVASFDIK